MGARCIWPWWGYNNNAYVWHAGYWGPHIGFHGGNTTVSAGVSAADAGAYRNSGAKQYNRSVTNVNVSVVQ